MRERLSSITEYRADETQQRWNSIREDLRRGRGNATLYIYIYLSLLELYEQYRKAHICGAFSCRRWLSRDYIADIYSIARRSAVVAMLGDLMKPSQRDLTWSFLKHAMTCHATMTDMMYLLYLYISRVDSTRSSIRYLMMRQRSLSAL